MLVEKLHQSKFREQIINNINEGHFNHLIQNKPRSGKTALMLRISYDLMNSLNKKDFDYDFCAFYVNSFFIEELNKWDIFKHVIYKEQKDFMNLKNDFYGICFTSVQYLKNDNDQGDKKQQLKNINFDVSLLMNQIMDLQLKKHSLIYCFTIFKIILI